MRLKTFIEKIKWDTSLTKLRQYASGDIAIPIKNLSDREKIKLYITKLIPIREKENEQFCYDFLTSDLCNMAEIYLKQKKVTITKNKIIDTAFNILNVANRQHQTHLLRCNRDEVRETIPEIFNDIIRIKKG